MQLWVIVVGLKSVTTILRKWRARIKQGDAEAAYDVNGKEAAGGGGG